MHPLSVRQAVATLSEVSDRLGDALAFLPDVPRCGARTRLEDELSTIADRLDGARCVLERSAGGIEAVNRREILKFWPLPVVAASAPLAVWERIASAPGSSRVDASVLDAERRLSTSYAASYDSSPVGVLTEHTVGQLGRVRRLADASLAPGIRSDTLSLVGEQAAFVGWLAFAANEPRDAERHFTLAASAAQEATDGPLYAAVALSLGELYSSRLFGNKHAGVRTALDIAEDASGLVDDRVDPRVRSWIHARLAVLYASAGSGGLFFDHIDKAWALLSVPVDSEALGFFSSGGRFATWDDNLVRNFESTGLLRLGRPEGARELAVSELAGLPAEFGKRRTNALVVRGRAELDEGELDAAASSALEGLRAARRVGYPLGVGRVRELRARMGKTDTRAVRELDAELAA